MSAFGAVGTDIRLIFRTKFLTFTPDQFNKAMSERSFFMAQAQIPSPQNPQARIAVPMFSKKNVNVILQLATNQIVFQVINTLDLKETYKDIKKILLDLNVVSTAVQLISLICTTNMPSTFKPQAKLTALINPKFLEGISEGLGVDLGITSIRLATSFPLARDGIQVVIEPLGTSPNDHCYFHIAYQTTEMEKFNQFISNFSEETVRKVIEEVGKIE